MVCVAWGVTAPCWAAAPLRDDIVRDFRGSPLPGDMALLGNETGRFLKSEPDGLRLTLPRDRKDAARLGLSLPLSLQGDFEITVAFDILHADAPLPGRSSFGVGPMLSINEAARIGRLVRGNGNQVVTWDRWATVKGKREWLNGAVSADAASGKMRLKRTGTTLQFLWAPETAGENFEEVHQCDFGHDDITSLWLELNSDNGGKPAALDVRFRELRVRTEAGDMPSWLVPLAVGLIAGGLIGGAVGWRLGRRTRPATTA